MELAELLEPCDVQCLECTYSVLLAEHRALNVPGRLTVA